MSGGNSFGSPRAPVQTQRGIHEIFKVRLAKVTQTGRGGWQEKSNGIFEEITSR